MTFRIIVHSFVKDTGEVMKVKNVGASTLVGIIAGRPDRAQYAVGMVTHSSATPWWAIDLPSMLIFPAHHAFKLGDYWEYRDYDTALMATILMVGK